MKRNEEVGRSRSLRDLPAIASQRTTLFDCTKRMQKHRVGIQFIRLATLNYKLDAKAKTIISTKSGKIICHGNLSNYLKTRNAIYYVSNRSN